MKFGAFLQQGITCRWGTLKWDRVLGYVRVVATYQPPAWKIRTYKSLLLRS